MKGTRAPCRPSSAGPWMRAILLQAIVLATAPPLGSQSGDDFKIAVIFAQRLVTGSSDYQQAEETFRLEMADQAALLEAKREELRVAQERLISAADTLDAAGRADLVQDAERLQNEVDRMSEDIQSDMTTLQEELLAPIYDKVDAAILSYIEEFGFGLVLDGSNPALGLVSMDEATDITDAVRERMGAAGPESEVEPPGEIPPPN